MQTYVASCRVLEILLEVRKAQTKTIICASNNFGPGPFANHNPMLLNQSLGIMQDFGVWYLQIAAAPIAFCR
jgi:hypothetical protein